MASDAKNDRPHWSLIVGVTALFILTVLLGRSCVRREWVDEGTPEDSSESSSAAGGRTGTAESTASDRPGGPRGLGSVPPMTLATPGDGPVAESGPSDPTGKRARSTLIYEAAGKTDTEL